MTDQPVARDPGAQTFAELLGIINYGEASAAANDALRVVLQQMQRFAADNGGAAKGSVSLKLDLALAKGYLEATVKIDKSLPKDPAIKANLFLTADGRPTARDPRQMDLRFPTVAGGSAMRRGDDNG